MNALEKVLKEHSKQIAVELASIYTKIPSEVCGCGKPVVFPNGAKKFHCSRCGTKWILKIEVQKAPV